MQINIDEIKFPIILLLLEQKYITDFKQRKRATLDCCTHEKKPYFATGFLGRRYTILHVSFIRYYLNDRNNIKTFCRRNIYTYEHGSLAEDCFMGIRNMALKLNDFFFYPGRNILLCGVKRILYHRNRE